MGLSGRRRSARSHGAWIACSVLMCCASACAGDIERPGQIVVAIDTDMALPDQVDALHIEVEVNGQIAFQHQFDVGTKRAMLPATLALVGRQTVGEPVTVRMAGSKLGSDGPEWRTFREATTTLPRDRIATLRMPIQWLCTGTAEAIPRGDDSPLRRSRAQSSCGRGNTCRAGRCEPSDVDEPKLPDFAASDVYGGGETPEQGSCFDTVACMARAGTATPDADCTIERPRSDHFNVALRVLHDGICDGSGANCYVPLNGRNREGWMLAGDRVKLPTAACDRLAEGSVSAVVVSDTCQTKTEAVPTCGPWSDVRKGRAGEYRPDGEPVLSAVLLTTLPGDPEADRCCPLMAAAGKLYACVCASATNGTVFEIDPAPGATPRVVGALNPAENRTQPLAATVFEGALYWASTHEIRRTPLGPSTQWASGFMVPPPAALYQTGSLLADAQGLYALASGTGTATDDQAASVHLFAIPFDPARPRNDPIPLGNAPVFQFDQDDTSIYLALDHDLEQAGAIERRSAVYRLDKRSGQRTRLMPERRLITPLRERGGYVGVQVDEGRVFALYEALDEPGGARARVHGVSADSAGLSDPEIIYEGSLDPARSRLQLLGAVDGRAIVAQLVLDAGAVVSATLLVLPPGGGAPRVIAAFGADYPAAGLARDSERIYWLNASGQLYGLPRAALR